jgi:uncharacterized protein YqgV (UPF0045/DUF77 family)
LPYKVTEFGTVIEGSWEEFMSIAKRCHTVIRKKTDRVLILIRLDDCGDGTDLLSTTIAHVERHLGRAVKK